MQETNRPPLTKMIATIGPATADEEIIARLIEAGVAMFRLNFSHGSLDEHERHVSSIRAAGARLGTPIGIFGDLQGPKIRIGSVAAPGVDVPTGATVLIQRQPIEAKAEPETLLPPSEGGRQGVGGAGQSRPARAILRPRSGEAGPAPAAAFRFSTTYPALIDDVQPGQRLLINDGAVRLLIIEKRRDEIVCSVTHGGLITSSKGINLPDSDLALPSMSDRDWEHAQWAVRHDLDYLALSFVRCADDVRALREGVERISQQADRGPGSPSAIDCDWGPLSHAKRDLSTRLSAFGGSGRGPADEDRGPQSRSTAIGVPCFRMPVIAKIETPRAVEQIDSILDAADAIMIARGDLGVEMELARVPVIQKRLQTASDNWGKPCIVATQMLESMIGSPNPTRAEASDVAGAIFDGADAVMLSGETAVGKYPVVAVEHMRRIALAAEEHLAALPQRTSAPQKLIETRYRTAALAHGVWTVAQDINASLVVVWSQQGGGARYLSQNNFRIHTIAVTSDERAARRMQLLRGVVPVRMPQPPGLAEFTRRVDEHLLGSGWAKRGDTCVLVAGAPLGATGVTNSLAIHAVGSPETGYARM